MADVNRIGIFGGAFDPPHVAHQAMARAALAQYKLDLLRVIPTGSAWHKARPLTDATHRLAMVHLAFDDLQPSCVDCREIEREGPTYTIDTLTAVRRENPEAALYLFIGEDQARAFKSWHRWEDILQMATVVVAQRPETQDDTASPNFEQWHNGVSAEVQRLDMTPQAVSATDIRSRIARGAHLPPLLPLSVQRYIEQHSLYQTHSDDRLPR